MPSRCLEIVLKIHSANAVINRKHRVQRRHDTRPVQAIPVDRAAWSSDRNSGVIHKIIWAHNVISINAGVVGDVMVEIVELADNPVLRRICKCLI